jgi:hypothetical protein
MIWVSCLGKRNDGLLNSLHYRGMIFALSPADVSTHSRPSLSFRLMVCVVVLLAPLAGFAGLSFASTSGAFPPVQLEAMDQSNKLVVPNNRGHVFVAVGFHPKWQHQIEQTLLQVNSLQAVNTSLQIAEIPVIDTAMFSDNGLTRLFMKNQIKQKSLLKNVYPYFTQLKMFQQRLGLTPAQQTFYALVNSKGQIIWQKSSPPLAADITKLKALIK